MSDINRHHLVPKVRQKNGDWSKQGADKILRKQTIRVKVSRHNAYHHFFGTKTLDEAINFLVRLRSFALRKAAKNRRKIIPMKD